jgi:magnesium-transporting ATPase (P-type)
MERLQSNSKYTQQTSEHLQSFAENGLRTLCLAYRVLPADEYEV